MCVHDYIEVDGRTSSRQRQPTFDNMIETVSDLRYPLDLPLRILTPNSSLPHA